MTTTPSVPSIPDLAERLRELHEKLPAAPWRWHLWPTRMGVDVDNDGYRIFERQAYGDPDLACLDAARTVELRNTLAEIISSLEELSRLKAGEGWRDMQSAPRDGSMFLMGYVGHPEWGTKVCMRKVQHLRTDAGFEVKDLGSWALVNGIDDDLAETDSTSGNPEWSTAPDAYNDMATWHWRPLPPAPGGRSDG